jgi:serine protease Do
MGKVTDLKNGQWCVAIGHPGGFRKGRTPVVRLGRVLFHNENMLRTDCTIQGGDSGGPLFDLDGKVIGIHSRIGGPVTANIHVPVDTYRDTWDRLAASEVWGSGIGDSRTGVPFLGVEFDQEARECIIAKVLPGTGAEKAGIRAGDTVVRFDTHAVAGADDLVHLVSKKHAGDRVTIEVQRDDEIVKLRVTLGRRAD